MDFNLLFKQFGMNAISYLGLSQLGVVDSIGREPSALMKAGKMGGAMVLAQHVAKRFVFGVAPPMDLLSVSDDIGYNSIAYLGIDALNVGSTLFDFVPNEVVVNAVVLTGAQYIADQLSLTSQLGTLTHFIRHPVTHLSSQLGSTTTTTTSLSLN